MKKDLSVIYSFSVTVTERCDSFCTYCHYYATRPRKSAKRDISDDLFALYMRFIRRWRSQVGGDVSYRFSGGEPLVLKDRLFDLSAKGYLMSGLKPYVLTSGRGLDSVWMEEAANSNISHLFVSLEDPLDPDPGSPDPYETMYKIRRYNSQELPLYLGATLVKNRNFKNIYEICAIVFDSLGCLPNITEYNYQAYSSPTDQELKDLTGSIGRVLKTFGSKSCLNLFPYISPELSDIHQKKEAYLMELDINNKYRMTMDTIEGSIRKVLDNITANYPLSGCRKRSCPYFTACTRIKWLWKGDLGGISAQQRFRDYCRLKKAINSAFESARP